MAILGRVEAATSLWYCCLEQIRKGTEQYKAERIALIEGLRQHFPNADLSEIMNYMNSLPGQDEQLALQKLYEQKLKAVEISQGPFSGNITQSEKQLLSFDDVSSGKNNKRP